MKAGKIVSANFKSGSSAKGLKAESAAKTYHFLFAVDPKLKESLLGSFLFLFFLFFVSDQKCLVVVEEKKEREGEKN